MLGFTAADVAVLGSSANTGIIADRDLFKVSLYGGYEVVEKSGSKV